MIKKKVTGIVIPDIAEQLRELALIDMEKFMKLTQIDTVQVFVCLEKGKGKSNGQIAQRLSISRQAVSERCKKCQGDD